MPVCRIWLLTAACALSPPAPLAGAEPNDRALLDEVRDRHRAALDAIRTVIYTEEFQELKWAPTRDRPDGAPGASSGGPVRATRAVGPAQFWRTPETWRYRALMSDGTTWDELFRFGRLLHVSTPAKQGVNQELTVSTQTSSAYPCGRIGGFLFEHWSRDTAFLPFHALLDEPHDLLSIKRLSTQPADQVEIHVVLKHDRSVNEFWFSPKHNYLIRKHVEHPAAQPHHRHEHEVAAFAEPHPGQFFPNRVEHRSFEEGGLKGHTRHTLSNIRINQAVPKEAFRIPGIEGQWCDDYSTQQRYRINADGFRVGPTQPISTRSVQPLKLSFAAPNASPEPSESGSLAFWLGAAACVLLLLLGTAGFEIRWLRKQLREHAPR